MPAAGLYQCHRNYDPRSLPWRSRWSQGCGHPLWTAPWGHRIVPGCSHVLWLGSPGSALCSPALVHRALTSLPLMILQHGSCWIYWSRQQTFAVVHPSPPHRSVWAVVHTGLHPSHSGSSSQGPCLPPSLCFRPLLCYSVFHPGSFL